MTVFSTGRQVCAEGCCVAVRDSELPQAGIIAIRGVFVRPMFSLEEFSVMEEKCSCGDAASSTAIDIVAWPIMDTDGNVVFDKVKL